MDPLVTNTSMCTILLQPFFPKAAITTPQGILIKAKEYSIDNYYYGSFPETRLKPIQDGIINFEWRTDGDVRCQQIYAAGLLYEAYDVLRVTEKGKIIYLSIIPTRLFMMLLSASKFFLIFGYQGGWKGFLRLENIEGTTIYPVLPEGYHLSPFFFEDRQSPILSKDEWDLE